jgi:hypothetical protein
MRSTAEDPVTSNDSDAPFRLVALNGDWWPSMGLDQARTFWILIVGYLLVGIYVTSWAGDLWQGLAAVFPVFVQAALVMHEKDPTVAQRWLPRAALAMVLMPQLEQMGPDIRWMRPLPVALVEWVTNRSVIDLLNVRMLLPQVASTPNALPM